MMEDLALGRDTHRLRPGTHRPNPILAALAAAVTLGRRLLRRPVEGPSTSTGIAIPAALGASDAELAALVRQRRTDPIQGSRLAAALIGHGMRLRPF